MTILLAIMLMSGFVFLLIPVKYFKRSDSSLKITRFSTIDIKAIILFVGTSRSGETLEDLLAYKILNLMSSHNRELQKQVWLIHGDISDQQGASYYNTYQLVKRFKSEYFNIHPYGIEDIFDANETFRLVNRIFLDVEDIKHTEIVCDCTSGTKLMTLGMALACIGKRRLIYFPKTTEGDAKEYIEIDTKTFLRSITTTLE